MSCASHQALSLVIRSVMSSAEDPLNSFIDGNKMKRTKTRANPISKWNTLGIPSSAAKLDAAMRKAHDVAMRIRTTKDLASGPNESLSSLKTAENPIGLAGAKVLANCLDPTILRFV